MNKIQMLRSKYKKTLITLYKKVSKRFKTTSLRDTYTYKKIHYKHETIVKANKTYILAKKHSFFSFVILPTLVVAIYYVVLASPRYESSAIASLRQNNTAPMVDSSLSSILGGGGSDNSANSYLLIDYILSPQMLDKLQADLNIKAMYQNPKVDFFSRLSHNADQIDFLDYYNKMVSLSYNQQSNAITINVQGYTAEQAQKVLDTITKDSQEIIDHISHTLAENRMKFNKEQLDIIKTKAMKAQDALVEFQNSRGIVDPEGSVSTKATVIGSLQGQLTAAETQLTNLKSYLSPNSSEVKATEQQIIALKKQIDKEKADFLAEDKESQKQSQLDDMVSNYTWLKLNAEFAMTEYQSALQSFETAKLDSQNQQSYLVDIVKPTLPDSAKYPRIIYNLITIFVILSALYGLGRMIITIILENR
ncbi:sugar ABC transporter [Francisella philomiragia]|uniref:Capsular polysaccharide ABC transporter n=1 Tax=Francisella philomiragia subsp. philomiragia (strain ATCC 25017 / CCUG 19701 / FSC 153 / O\|nr:sugar ABC transporter [Francisella philomiragia]AJI46473.1 chain length determinant family protein [Francisella philomiragia]AJI48860.1 chain length determinant family protein [Francisella philomiragia]MBK2019692.1 sugar ABC transporter [Francisella philomiragia]MBK2029524.1 sugar ABC transporter [Francisella philomiragia]MBK2264025.1 sugar ABC transporter [Francisella philomiragia]